MLMLFIAFFGLSSFAESPNPPRAGRFETRATYSYFTSEENYSSSNNGVLLKDGSFTNMLGELSAIYDWQPDWRFYGGGNFSWVEADNNTDNFEQSGANEIFLGAQKWYESGPFDIAPQVDFIFPLWRVDESANEALIGEGAMRLRGGAWLFWPQLAFKPFGYLGFEYRDEGRAFLMPYSAGLKVKVPYFWVQGEFRGYQTFVKDADSSNEVVREDYLNRVNAGSMRYYPINPSVAEAAVEGGTQFGSVGIFGGFAISVFGDNAADGWTAYGGLSFTPQIERAAKPRETTQETFTVPKESYDESLFKGEVRVPPPAPKPPPPKPPPPVAPSKPVDLQLELRRVPPKKKKTNSKKMNKMMNEAEKALENAN